jgi:hypothetical protein
MTRLLAGITDSRRDAAMTSIFTARTMSSLLMFVALVVFPTMPLAAQTQTAGDERVTVAGGLDFRNAYMFRGVRQDDTGMITWPSAEVGLRLHSAGHGLTSARVRVGSWNSLHSGWAGSDGPSGKRWYESDTYATLALGFGNAASLDTTYRAYRSPNKMFTAVKEISVKTSMDRASVARAALKPYVLAAFELDTQPGIGQLDGGFKAGRYLELGGAPGYSIRHIGIAAPVKVGLSLGNYYELAGKDHRFGFISVAGTATLPLTHGARAGSWDVHGGIEYQRLGTTPKAFNGGKDSKTVASIGMGFSR